MPTANILIEAELREPTPRPVRWTEEGRRVMLLSLAPAVILLSFAAAFYVANLEHGRKAAAAAACLLIASGVLFRLLLLWRARARLVAHGLPVVASVIEKEPGRRGWTEYYGWYEAGGKHYGVGWLAGPADAEIGDAVTVLYWPDNPAEAVVYRACGCVAARESRRPVQDQLLEYPRI